MPTCQVVLNQILPLRVWQTCDAGMGYGKDGAGEEWGGQTCRTDLQDQSIALFKGGRGSQVKKVSSPEPVKWSVGAQTGENKGKQEDCWKKCEVREAGGWRAGSADTKLQELFTEPKKWRSCFLDSLLAWTWA